MIALLLKKRKSLKMNQKKQQKFLITAIQILKRPLLEIEPPQSAVLISNIEIEQPQKKSLNFTKTFPVLGA